ncbi:M6 family metallopeptidase [Halosimplex salinum]|uniref:immune inhibitor A domain-containing protein n=1 Tax=Halosimplex salinum TaxID=1710538 RepID=UPI001F41FABD|nr:immune inhibitor A domain-containing protein [Halosimplex salinum]
MRSILMAAVVVLSMVTAGVGGVTAVSTADDDAEPSDRLIPREDRGNVTDGYRAIEPTQNWTDKPVDLDTAPPNFPDGEGANGSASAAESDSIVMDPDDEDHPLVGTTKQYLGSDQGSYYFKEYTLLSVGDEIEVWVANDLSWPAGDSREDPTISESQAESMAEQFDENMYPVESETFGDPVARNGTESLLEQLGAVPEDYYETGENSSRTVLLVDNVRDQNYYDEEYPLYIAGFYSPTIQDYTDRNTITLDAFGWNEVNETNQRTGYEGTLAHEYQHLIHADLDGDETTWVNEGMSDYAEVITGYGVSEGHLSAYEEMPSNSLTNWEDQGAINVLADYGVAFTWTMYLDDQYGREFISNLASDEANGVESVENTLDEVGAKRDFADLYQDFSTAVVTDDIRTPPKDEFHIDGLDVNVNTSGNVGTAGVWGTNYREIDTSERGPIKDVTVSGTDFTDTEWSTATDPVTGEGEVLYSGSGNLLDRHAIVETDLSDTEDTSLTFESYQRIEANWDYGFVQVSTDGGETWESLSNENTDDSPSADAHPRVKENVPGLTGDTDGWENQSFDLSAYEGNESVLVSFRYVTDWAFVKDGWWVRNVSVAGESVATNSTEPYQSEREATGDNVEYQFTFVGIKHNGNYQVKQIDTTTFDESGEQDLQQFLRNGNFDKVVVASTWAPEGDESGRVPVGVEFTFAGDEAPGNGNGNNGNGNGQK